jgi:NADPH-dependent 2,4-dienoyl-CoA reductase/sulfur reductase-like enzyme/nitrite reductase/ring-hydroxylating ferredoxin subunit
MGGGADELTGPDFTAGVDLASLRDGEPTLGHAQGEAVVLVRRGGDVFAVGAKCTHYGGPLGEGICGDDGTIRCPWHHARFDLKTGEAAAAPALGSIPCFAVEQKGGRVVVGAKKEPPPIQLGTGPRPKKVLIVGGGPAGHAAAEMLRRRGFEGDVTLVSEDASPPVDRPNLSKDYLAGTAPEEWMPLPDVPNVTMRLGARVEAIDVAGKKVTLASGEAIAWDALLLATGASPRRLDVPGASLPHVHVLRTLGDSRAIIAAATKAKRACVLGASFIGLEVAASLRARGLEVDVVAPEAKPLARVMGDDVADFVKALHEEHGVRFHLGRTSKSIDARAVTLDSGAAIEADLVVTGVGVVPSLDLAQRAGLAIDRGVVVDEHLATSAPGVWAAGDVARWPDRYSGARIRVEHWVVAQRMGQTAARNILGAKERFAFAPFFWSQHYDVAIAYVGHAEKFDRAEVVGSVAKRDFAVVLHDQGKPMAVVTVGRDRASLACERSMEGDDFARVLAIARQDK